MYSIKERYTKEIYMYIYIIILNIVQYIGVINNTGLLEPIIINKYIGIESSGIILIWLTCIIIPMCMYINPTTPWPLISRDSQRKELNKKLPQISYEGGRNRGENNIIFMIYILLILSFSTYNILTFYIYFDMMLIPLFYLIGRLGKGYLRIESSIRLFIWTFLGSIIFLLPLISIYNYFLTFNTFIYQYLDFSEININIYMFVFAIFLPYIIKMPSYPFFSWLPYAHAEASTSGSIILAALILKLAPFAIYRFILPINILTPFYTFFISIAIFSIYIAILAILYSDDLKKIFAYSSIVHMNISLILLLLLHPYSYLACFLTILSHSFISTGLFLLVNFLYVRFHLRSILYYQGLSNIYPLFSIFFFLFTLANLSFPLTFAFIAEFFALYLIFIYSPIISFILFISIFLFSVLLFYFLVIILWGHLSIPHHLFNLDIYFYEFLPFFVLLFFIFFFGIFPSPIINYLASSLIL